MKKIAFLILFVFALALTTSAAVIPQDTITARTNNEWLKTHKTDGSIDENITDDPHSFVTTGTNLFLYHLYGFDGTASVCLSDTGLGTVGSSYRLNLTDNGDAQHFSNVVIGETLQQFYSLATQVRLKYLIPTGYPILRFATILGSTAIGDTGWCTSPLYTVGSSTWFQTISPVINPSGQMSLFNQIYLALHSPVPGGGGVQYLVYLDEIEVYVNGVWILVDPGTGINSYPPKPTLGGPINGTVFYGTQQCGFTWPTVAGAIYEFQVSTNPNFTNIVIDNTNAIPPMCINLSANGFYWWRVRAKFAGQPWGPWSLTGNFQISINTAINQIGTAIPEKYGLEQNYPNPFNPVTKIKFAVPKSGNISLRVYDMIGREIQTLASGQVPAGFYETEFDASNLSSGVYFYKFDAGTFIATKKMLLVK